MPSLIGRLTSFARSPQGRRTISKAQRWASSPEGRRRIEQIRRRGPKKR